MTSVNLAWARSSAGSVSVGPPTSPTGGNASAWSSNLQSAASRSSDEVTSSG